MFEAFVRYLRSLSSLYAAGQRAFCSIVTSLADCHFPFSSSLVDCLIAYPHLTTFSKPS